MFLACCFGLDVQAQQISGDFDAEWVACYPYQKASSENNTQVGTQPVGWKVANVAYMSGYQVAAEETHGEGKAVKLTNCFMGVNMGIMKIGQNAPAYLTLGTPWNAANGGLEIKEKDGGTFGGTSFAYKPDAVSFQYKRSLAESSTEVASVVAYLWKGDYTSSVGVGIELGTSPTKETMTDRDRDVLADVIPSVASGLSVSRSEDAACIAYINETISGNQEEWTPMTIPFTYVSDEAPEKFNVIFSAADYFGDRDAIDEGNILIIDDVKLLYYSELATFSYDGEEVQIAESMDLSDKEYEASKLMCTSNGRGAVIEPRYDEETGVLTITVKGNDWTEENRNEHVYTVQFKAPVKAPEAAEVVGTYGRWLTVAINGDAASESANDIIVGADDEGTYTLQLNNFAFGGLSVGDIVVPGTQAAYAEDGSIDLTATANVTIDLFPTMPLPTTVNLNLATTDDGDKVMTGEIDIDFSLMGMAINVAVGDVPFQTEADGRTLKVTGTVSALAAPSVVPADGSFLAIDLTEATTGEGLTTDNFTNTQPNTLFYVADAAGLAGSNVVAGGACADLVITDAEDFYVPANLTATRLAYNRTLTAGQYAAVVLPFDVDASLLDGKAYLLDNVEDDVLAFVSAEGTIGHDTPFLFLPSDTLLFAKDTELTAVSMYATPEEAPAVAFGSTAFTGTYTSLAIAQTDAETWYTATEDEFQPATDETLPAFRAAVKGDGSHETYRLSFDGKIVGISAPVLTPEAATADVYTVDGKLVRRAADATRALEGLPAGIYIVNGKKVVK